MTSPVARVPRVTDREHEVLALLAGHLTNVEIAERLFVSPRTVESHVSSLIRKLEVGHRRGLARRAEEVGLLGPRTGPRMRGRWPESFGEFLGRAGEMATLADLLDQHRMVTVAGPGGVGKTRFTTHTVRQLTEQRSGGAWFVDLSQVTDARAVVPAVAAAVGVVESPGRSVEEGLSTLLSSAGGVLVLDNCEHLLAAVELCVRRLLEDCPELTVVATSRARLGAPYERVYELPGLPVQDAVLLFHARASSAGGVVPDDPRVATLCSRLEGMALAIELAAARYPSLGLDGLTAALDDPLLLLGSGEARQHSLRATIAWSVDLLGPDERAVLAACSVFASPFTVAAVRAVASPDHTQAAVARALADLADQHLLRAQVGSPTTYRFQEVVRQYAAELLVDHEAVEQRHATWVRAELTSLAALEHDSAWCEVFDALAVEVRAVLGRGMPDTELGEAFAEQLVLRGRLEEAQVLFERLAEGHQADRVRFLRLAAGAAAARLVGDEVMRLLDEAVRAAGAARRDDDAADALAWSVIYAVLAPGIMANVPSAAVTAQRLAQARRRAPRGSAAEATVLVATAASSPDEDPDAERGRLHAADRALAAGLPVTASAALDGVCAARLLRFEYADALAAVVSRGLIMDPLPLDATTAYAFNDYLLMGCEVSLAAGDLPGAAAYSERLMALPCYREYVHPALTRRVEVDVLAGDLAGAVRHGALFRRSWEQAGRHQASTLAVGPYALALAEGLLGHDAEREDWLGIARYLASGASVSLDRVETGWAPTLDAWLLLHRGRPDAALAVLSAELDDPVWRRWSTALWRPWYAAAWAEASALSHAPALEQRLQSAAAATRDNPVAAALVHRAAALATGDVEAAAASAATLERLGASYQRDRSRQLSA